MSAHKFTWLNLPHLPDVPQHFIDRAFALANPEGDLKFKDNPFPNEWFQRIVTYKGVKSETVHQESLQMGEDWNDWIRENIVSQWNDTAAKLSVGPTGGVAPVHGAHVDNYSKVRFIYLLDRGGEDAETVWFLQPGKPLVFEDHDNYVEPGGQHIPVYCDDMDSLIEIERAKFPLKKWVALNGLIMHSVVGLTSPRLILSIAVSPEYFDFSIVSK